MKVAIVLSTPRASGNTSQLTKLGQKHLTAHLLNLSKYAISGYDYHSNNLSDDFITVMDKLLVYDHIIFAPPIY